MATKARIKAQQASSAAKRAVVDAAQHDDSEPIIQLALTTSVQEATKSASAEEDAQHRLEQAEEHERMVGKAVNQIETKLLKANKFKDLVQKRWKRLQDRADKKAAAAQLWLANLAAARTAAVKAHAEAAQQKAAAHVEAATALAVQLRDEATKMDGAAEKGSERASHMNQAVSEASLAATLARSKADIMEMVPVAR